MVKLMKGALISALLLVGGLQATAQDAAAYDGTGVKPPKELLLKEGRTIGDIRLPKAATVNAKKSVILGGGANSFGKIFSNVRADSDKVARFFLDTMPGDGWELISEFQSDDLLPDGRTSASTGRRLQGPGLRCLRRYFRRVPHRTGLLNRCPLKGCARPPA